MSARDRRRSPVAQRILHIVRGQPGIHFRGLERAAGLTSAGQLRHHLDHLRRRGHIIEVSDGGFLRFFAAGEHDRRLRTSMARFARPVPRRIAKLLLRSEMNRTELRSSLGCADSTLGYYLERMHQQGDLIKEPRKARCYYALADPESVRRVLAAQQGGAGPDHLLEPQGSKAMESRQDAIAAES